MTFAIVVRPSSAPTVADARTAVTVRKNLSSATDSTRTSLVSIPKTNKLLEGGNVAKTGPDRFVHGTRPVHTHIDSDGDRWNCNSPYCIDMQTDPPDKGGPPIILEGLEP